MTIDEFEKDWQDYELVSPDGKVSRPLQDIACFCLGKFKGGILLDSGGPQGSPAYVFRTDEDDNCYMKTDWDASDEEGWELVGRLRRLSTN